MPSISLGKVKHTRIAWDRKDSVVVLSVNIGIKLDRIELIYYEREFGLAQLRLKGQQLANEDDAGEEKGKTAGPDPDNEEFLDEGFASKEIKLKSEPRSKKSMHAMFPMESPRVRKMRLIY
jgi:hypothetical protein